MNQKPEHLAVLDVGNSMTRALLAEVPAGPGSRAGRDRDSDDASLLRFLGFAEVESEGWHKGNLTDIGQVSASIGKAIEQASHAAGAAVESAVVGIGGPHLQGISSRAGIQLASRPREVRREDVLRVMEAARDVPLSPDRDILHLVPKEFVLDSQDGIRDPVGMAGSHLEVRVHILTGLASASQNLVTAANRAGLLVETLVGEAFACGEAVPTEEERELGVLVAVIGGPGCEIAAYVQGGLGLASAVPVGGDHFTGDLAIGLRTSRADAEAIKKAFGSVFPGWTHDGTSFEVPGMGHQPSRLISHRVLRQILEPRATELFGLLRSELRRRSLEHHLAAGVILSGGGARMAGICDLAEKILEMPARIGLPPKMHRLPEPLDSPEYATLVSLAHYGMRLRQQRGPRESASANRFLDLLSRKK
jgi:cell division protein FtsA